MGADDEIDTIDKEIYQRALLSVDHSKSITLKRDVRRLDVSAPPAEFAKAFHSVMSAAGARFGLIEILRTKEKTGKPFELGERFQGRFSIEQALLDEIRDSFLEAIGGWLARVINALEVDELLEYVADKAASDYGVIEHFNLDPAPGEIHSIRYAYLEGTPIAGSSTFTIEALDGGKSRFTQVFEYQEQQWSIVHFMSTVGLRMHNDVVYSEVDQAAKLLGAKILHSDITPSPMITGG